MKASEGWAWRSHTRQGVLKTKDLQGSGTQNPWEIQRKCLVRKPSSRRLRPELLSIWTKISIKMMLQSINDQHGWWHYFIIIRRPILLVTLQPKVCIHMHREQICKLPVYLWFHILWDKISKHLTKSHEHSLISSFLHVKEHCLPAVNVVLASLHHLAMEKSGSEGIVERWKNIRQRKRRRERRRRRMSIR